MKKIQKILKRQKKKLALAAAIAALFIVYAHLETYRVEIKAITVKNNDLPLEFSGKKIVFISDTHCGEYFDPKRLGSIVERINLLAPDIILFGGDYVSRDGKNTTACFAEYAKLAAPLGKFGVLGNHDIEAGKNNIIEAMLAAKIVPLVNENRAIAIGNRAITVAGVDETWYGTPDGAAAMANAADFTVYLSHDPAYFEEYTNNRAKLLLAGHTHGGQVTLFGLSMANLAHRHNYKYGQGIYEEPNRTIIVTNGIGATILPLRFFARPQINVIILEK